jgi:Flp pilus assembly protein TadB
VTSAARAVFKTKPLPQRLKRCATQKQSWRRVFSATSFHSCRRDPERTQNLKKSFQIVLSGRGPGMPKPSSRPGRLRRLPSLAGGFVAAAFLIGTLIAAIIIGSAIAFVLWIAVVVAIVAVVIVILVRKLTRQARPHQEPNPFIDER